MANPPYFDGLFSRLATNDAATMAAFGRHVHWGYWAEPSENLCSPAEYGTAAEDLCRLLCDTAGVQDGMRVLDVGCGFGGTLASLNDRHREMQLVGVNIDGRQLARAADLVKPRNGNSIEWIEADAASIPLSDASFDVVLAVECVFHFDRTKFFAESARLLRHGGNLTLSDFVPSERAAEYFQAIDLSGDESVRWSYGDIDLSCSPSRYKEIADTNGIRLGEVIDITMNTLPTYPFLYSMAGEWADAKEVDLFTRATRLLEKSCRKKLIGYQILRFDRP